MHGSCMINHDYKGLFDNTKFAINSRYFLKFEKEDM